MNKSKLITVKEYSDTTDTPLRTVHYWWDTKKIPKDSNILGFDIRFGRKLLKVAI